MSKKTGDQPTAPDPPATEKAKRIRVDWEAIERDYRAGKLTLREIATKHGCTNGRICQVAKEKQWVRGDLEEIVRKATQAALIEQDVSAEVSRVKQGLSDTVAAAVEVNKQIILAHRGRATKAVGVALRMLEELDATTTHAKDLAELFERITEDTEGPALAAAQQRFNDLMKLHNRVGSVHKLLDALAKAQAMERQSHNITESESAEEKSRRTIPIVFVDAEPQPE